MPQTSRFALALALALLVLLPPAPAQDTGQAEPAGSEDASPAEPNSPPTLPEMVVTATRSERDSFEVPYSTWLISEEDIARRLPRTLPDALRETPGLMIQRTSHGQGSPFLRGLTGFRTLLLVDGVRLNNSAFRDGPNQYWGTVDPLTIESLDVVLGPSSVLYGSDALGGTVVAHTRSRDSWEPGGHCDQRLFLRYATAEDALVARAEVEGNIGERFGWLMGVSPKEFGDLRGGEKIGRQPHTGYHERDGDLKLIWSPRENLEWTLAVQHVSQTRAPRTHATRYAKSWHGTTAGTDRKRDFDQARDLVYLQCLWSPTAAFVDRGWFSLSWQRQAETENQIRRDRRRTVQGLDVDTVGLSTQLESPSPIGRLTWGLEYARDGVDSFRRDYRANGTLDRVRPRGPVADSASYDLLGGYVQDAIPLADRWEAILGARFTWARAQAGDVDPDPTDAVLVEPVSESWTNVVGSARVSHRAGEHWNLYAGVSQGFRAPNLSDLTRFDIALSGETELPTDDLDPEHAVSYEIGAKARYSTVEGALSCSYMTIDDFILRFRPDPAVAEVRKKNFGDGQVQSVEAAMRWRFHPRWALEGGMSWTENRIDQLDPTEGNRRRRQPIQMMPPLGAALGLRWTSAEGRTEVGGTVQLTGSQDRYSGLDKLNTQRVPPGGLPGVTTLTLQASHLIRENLRGTLSIENLTNRDYRTMGSGVNEAGTNLIVGVDWRF